MRIAVIPARGGSKRIPRKNIKEFRGRPIINWSIATAVSSGLFDHVIVSTDDEEIRRVALAEGASVPFKRPHDLSNDMVGITPVIAHATRWALSEGMELEAVCCIAATAPLLRCEDLVEGWQKFHGGDWDFVFSATDFAAPIFRAFRKLTDGGVEMFYPENFSKRSQDLPTAFHDAGMFYWGTPTAWLENRPVFSPSSSVVLLPRWRVQDIDDLHDWRRAELLAQILSAEDQAPH